MVIIFDDVDESLKRYITGWDGVLDIGKLASNACRDIAIECIPEIFDNYSIKNDYFYDTPRNTDLMEMKKALSESFDDAWWGQYAAYILCQAVCNLPEMHPRGIDVDGLNKIVVNYISDLQQVFFRYIKVLYVQKYFAQQYKALISDTKGYREQYISILKGSIVIHELWYSSGMWHHPEIEIYFHIIKLLAIGMGENEVSPMVQELKNGGLSVPDALMDEKWKANFCYMFGDELISYKKILSCFSGKIKNAGDAEPLIRFLFEIAPKSPK